MYLNQIDLIIANLNDEYKIFNIILNIYLF